MILNIIHNHRILQHSLNIELSDFTILTGENGAGKTQLLEYVRDHSYGIEVDNSEVSLDSNIVENRCQLKYPLLNDDGSPLKDVVYSYPGLSNGLREPINTDQGLLNNIRKQWEEIESIVLIYHMLRGKEFESENQELQEINMTAARLATKIIQTSPYGGQQANLKPIHIHQIQQIKKLSEQSGKVSADLNFLDMIIFYTIPLSLFSSALDLLFHQFYLKKKYYPELTNGISAPWDIFNEIIEKAHFKYRAEYVESKNDDESTSVRLIDKSNGKQVSFQELSSGETTIMALVFALYNSSNNGHFPEVILFDEPDAHLHPSLTQTFLDVIQNVLIKEHHVKIILTTHSPSTIALCPKDSIYFMSRENGRPIQGDQRTALSILSNGLASLTIEESDLGLSYNISRTTKHILFTEGITDKIILETAWKKLYPSQEPMFFIQDSFDASFLGNLFNRGDDKPDGIFHQFPDRKMIALFDFDSAGYSNWNREKKFPISIETAPQKGIIRSNGKNGFLMLLPVPETPEMFSQVIQSNGTTYEGLSVLTIESLLFHVSTIKSFFDERPVIGGKVYVIKDKSKRELTNALSNLTPTDFQFFKILFNSVLNCLAL